MGCFALLGEVRMSLDEDTRWLEWVTKQFETIAGDDKEIDLEEFKTALKVKEVRDTCSLSQLTSSLSYSLSY